MGNGFVFDTTSNMEDINDAKIKDSQLVMMINDFPRNQAQRDAFERNKSNGDGWLGFYEAGYNDNTTNLPWFVNFLGGAVFYKKQLATLTGECHYRSHLAHSLL